MNQSDFGSSFANLMNEPLPPALDPRHIAFELFRRDQLRTKVLATLSIACWLIGTGGIFLLAYALNRLVIDIRVQSFMAARPGLYGAPAGGIDIAGATDLIHHSLPYVEGSVVALMLAALFTIALVFSSRQATLNRISISLMQISGQLRTMQQTASPTESASMPYDAYSMNPQAKLPLVGGVTRIVLVLALALIVGMAALLISRAVMVRREALAAWSASGQRSAFEAVRWKGDAPDVQVGGKWYELVAMNGLPAQQIVSFCKSADAPFWQKRFEENLVEVLRRFGYSTGATATLELKDSATGRSETLRDVPMTFENRQALLRAAQLRLQQRISE